MSHHDPDFQFCPVCGGRLRTSKLKENEPSRPVCSDCNFVYYRDPKVVACAIVELDNRIVLLRRSIQPRKGKWVMPGGYVDRGEGVEAAAIRETEEECGLKSRIVRLLGVYSYSGYVPVIIAYVAQYLSGDLVPRDETLEAKLFLEFEIPWDELAFRSTTDALRDYYLLKK